MCKEILVVEFEDAGKSDTCSTKTPNSSNATREETNWLMYSVSPSGDIRVAVARQGTRGTF